MKNSESTVFHIHTVSDYTTHIHVCVVKSHSVRHSTILHTVHAYTLIKFPISSFCHGRIISTIYASYVVSLHLFKLITCQVTGKRYLVRCQGMYMYMYVYIKHTLLTTYTSTGLKVHS